MFIDSIDFVDSTNSIDVTASAHYTDYIDSIDSCESIRCIDSTDSIDSIDSRDCIDSRDSIISRGSIDSMVSGERTPNERRGKADALMNATPSDAIKRFDPCKRFRTIESLVPNMLEALRVIPKTNICWDSGHSDASQISPTQRKNVEGGAGYEILDFLATHRIMDMPKIQETFFYLILRLRPVLP